MGSHNPLKNVKTVFLFAIKNSCLQTARSNYNARGHRCCSSMGCFLWSSLRLSCSQVKTLFCGTSNSYCFPFLLTLEKISIDHDSKIFHWVTRIITSTRLEIRHSPKHLGRQKMIPVNHAISFIICGESTLGYIFNRIPR